MDLERVADFLLATDPHVAAEIGKKLAETIAMLTQHPLVGRIVERGLRDWRFPVASQGTSPCIVSMQTG